MGTGRGRKEEQRLKTEADQATAAWQPSELENIQNQRTVDFLKQWGKGDDVKDISYLNPYMDLFRNAKNGEAAEKLGAGALVMSNPNSGMAERMRQQNEMRQEENAAGQLYDSANSAYLNATGVIAPQLMQMNENRVAGKARLANDRYVAFFNRPKQAPWWQQMLNSAAQGASSAATAGMMG